MTRMPVYRAKRKDDGGYIEGNLVEDEGVFYITKNPVIFSNPSQPYFTGESQYLFEIDPSTLAIHLPGMPYKNDKPIFASLSEGGKGGDIWSYEDHDADIIRYIVVFDKQTLSIGLIDIDNKDWEEFLFDLTDDYKARSEVTGIYEGVDYE